jgi:hypothetical protein
MHKAPVPYPSLVLIISNNYIYELVFISTEEIVQS